MSETPNNDSFLRETLRLMGQDDDAIDSVITLAKQPFLPPSFDPGKPFITHGRKSGCTVTTTRKSVDSTIFGHWHQPYVSPKWWHVRRRLRQFHYRMRNTQPDWWPKERS